MNSRYIDPYVVCPYYSLDESGKVKKLHCKGYKDGVFMQMIFKTKEAKKDHKKCFCNNIKNYENCPLYRGNTECQDEQIP